MDIKPPDLVRINCKSSAYDGIAGAIYEIQESSGYAIVLLPTGTELRIEKIVENKIRAQRKASKIKKPIPPGDPQWFPLEWLAPLGLDADGSKAPLPDLS